MQYKDFKNVQVMDHPLIKHKSSLLRNVNTGTYEFRQLVEEIATLEGYEALRDLPLKDVEIQTPLEKTMTPMIDGKKLAIVPILRAGLGMVPGVQALAPLAKVGIERLAKAHPDIEIYVGNVDRELNENAYILPGLGDAGDRIFGTK